MASNLKLGELLIIDGKLTKEQLEDVLEEQSSTKEKLGEILVNKGIIDRNELDEILTSQVGYPKIALEKYDIKKEAVNLIPEELARKHQMLVIDVIDNALLVAMVDPWDIFAVDDLMMFTKKQLKITSAEHEVLETMINKYYLGDNTKRVLQEFQENADDYDVDNMNEEELAAITNAPVVKLLNSIIEQAALSKASDIHIEPYENEVRVRFRVDGDLREIMTLGKNSLQSLVTRIKIMGNMNIAEKRVPLDGRVETKINGREIDLRLSTLPTVYGEKVVIRILDKLGTGFSIEGLGFSERNSKVFSKIISQPYGVLLVTGPTGSGKSTTLYSVLSELNKATRNVITVEDPVEYKLHGINQVQVNHKSGLDFAAALRSILRQDPDVIMVGEIRDGETAEIAARAAITGHLVLSTLHTNDSPSTITRLIDMGIEPYLVSSAVIGVLSQRLVKKLCNNCKQEYTATIAEKNAMGISENEDIKLHKAVGCNNCSGGYKGRTAIHELMALSEPLRIAIDTGAKVDKIREIALEDGMTTLLHSAAELAIKGVTSYDEVMRVGFTLG